MHWTEDSKNIIYSSPSKQAFYKNAQLFKISINGGLAENLNLGYAKHISFGSRKRSVIGRNTVGLERWKRYRGGTAGKIWIDNSGKGNFKEWNEVNGNFSAPIWIKERIYFISDHEGFGNLYSIKSSGADLKQHSKHKKFYVKQASSDKKNIVYINGGEIYVYNILKDTNTKVEVNYQSSLQQVRTKFVDGASYFQGYDIHPKGHSVALNARGQCFEMANWEGAVSPLQPKSGSRQRQIKYFNSGDAFILLADDGKKEYVEIHYTDNLKIKRLKDLNCGRILSLKVSPDDKFAAADNHKGELGVIDLEKEKWQLVAKSSAGRIEGYSWSHDSNLLTYAIDSKKETSEVMVYNLKSKEAKQITSGDFKDYDPVFSCCGSYIFFASLRSFNPVYDSIYFDLNFPKSSKIYAIVLNKEKQNPFIPKPKAPGDIEDELIPAKKEKTPEKVKIDFDGIIDRIVEMPIEEGNYYNLQSVKSKLLYISLPVRGALDRNIYSNAAPSYKKLMVWDFDKQEEELVANSVSDYKISKVSQTIALRSGNKLRVMAHETNGKAKSGNKKNRKDGWLDLSRLKVKVEPRKEWEQMFSEIWRLQKQQFWVENMSGVDWDKVYSRYFPLLDKISSRSELSDLAWEMQGELGTSHAYEIGGDYPSNKKYQVGLLGCDFVYDTKQKAYRITALPKGDNWQKQFYAPLRAPGVNAEVGDFVMAINNQKLTKDLNPYQALLNHANTQILLELRPAKSKKSKKVIVNTIGDEVFLRYRNWVEENRSYVHKKTKGRVGYVHLPNMGPWGYAEFHRYYATESQKDALIVDVRFNGGGHVSQLILEKLNRKQIGYDIARWSNDIFTYPAHSVNGPIIAITNEFAGSDGDIFSHCFKLMNLGKLIGKRTWGGVIGIWPRHFLIDGSVTTQPEFSFWFKDVGFGVENYGTDPDIEVEFTPQDFKKGIDPQIDRALKEIQTDLKKNPPYKPDFSDKPNLKLPH